MEGFVSDFPMVFLKYISESNKNNCECVVLFYALCKELISYYKVVCLLDKPIADLSEDEQLEIWSFDMDDFMFVYQLFIEQKMGWIDINRDNNYLCMNCQRRYIVPSLFEFVNLSHQLNKNYSEIK